MVTYDVTLASAGSFPDLETANRATNTILPAHAEQLTAFFTGSRKGTIRRMPPLRGHFDEPVGTVLLRDGRAIEAYDAVVLVHDVEGGALVFAAYPEEPLPPSPDLPALEVLFGAYLHADWPDEHPGPLAAVRLFAVAEDAALRRTAGHQLAELAELGDEPERRQAVRALGSYFVPRPDDELDRFLVEALTVLGR
jgi:hypothetical protein